MTRLRSLFAIASAVFATTQAGAQTKAECLASFDHGQELRNRSRLREARDEFKLCARAACSPPVRKDCSERLEEVMRDMPTLVLGARLSTGVDLPDVALFVDGERVTPEPGGAVPVDPGLHAVRFERPPYAPQVQEVLARIGEKSRLVLATFPAAYERPEVRPETSTAPARSESSPSPWAWILGGIGVAALGSFTFFAITGTQKHSQLEDSCKPACSSDEIGQVRTRFIAADVSLGVGLVALGVATYLFVVKPHPQRLARSF